MLIDKLKERYGLREIDSLWVGALEDQRIGFNQIECSDGTEPADYELDEWRAGKRQLYLCDYDFIVEKLVITWVELRDGRWV